MDSNGNRIRSLSSFKRLVSLVTLVAYVYTSFPVCCFSSDSIDRFGVQEIDEFKIQQTLLNKISEMKQLFASCENRNLEALKSIQFLLDEVAYKYNIVVSLTELLEIYRSNILELRIDETVRPYLTQIIDNFQITNFALNQTVTETIFDPTYVEQMLNSNHFEIYGYGIYPPWEWNWFGLNKKNSKSQEKKQVFASRQITYPGPIPEDDGSVPDDLIICAVEVLVIGLLLIIPSGLTQILAAAVAYDMGSRALESVKELSARNRENLGGCNLNPSE